MYRGDDEGSNGFCRRLETYINVYSRCVYIHIQAANGLCHLLNPTRHYLTRLNAKSFFSLKYKFIYNICSWRRMNRGKVKEFMLARTRPLLHRKCTHALAPIAWSVAWAPSCVYKCGWIFGTRRAWSYWTTWWLSCSIGKRGHAVVEQRNLSKLNLGHLSNNKSTYRALDFQRLLSPSKPYSCQVYLVDYQFCAH